MSRMVLLLQRSTDQEQALRQLLDQQQTKGSGNFHSWLTPEQFGKQFGPSDADIQAVTDWLTKQGFQIGKVSAGRTAIEFSGNVAQVRNAFHTEIHQFAVNGETHFANVSDPQIPRALSPVVAGVVALHNFPRQAHVKKLGVFRRDLASGQISPLVTYGTGTTPNFAVGPGDFAKIYNVPSTADGSGQTIAVVGQSNVNLQDVCDFRALFGLQPACPAYTDPNTGNLQVILNGPDPGISQPDEGESDLDLEWAGAIAPKANIRFVVAQSASTDPYIVIGGVDLAALYIVDNNVAPILSESYGICEAFIGSTGNAFYNTLWQQAAAEGITVAVSSGDSGSAGCDPDPSGASPNAAIDGVAVSGIASTPYNVAVGGTDFDPTTTSSTSGFWSTTSGTANSALKYMPETTWNNSACAINYPTTPCTSVASDGSDLTAGAGGPSNCSTLNGTSCSGGYPKPAYQMGTITPNTPGYTTRLIPDVSFFASNGQNGVALVTCDSDSNDQNGSSCSLTSTSSVFTLVGGTSASTPAFAGVIALVNQKTGQRQGNANYVLYGLASGDSNYTTGKCASSVGQTPMSTCAFNDVTKGNNSVGCAAGTPNCSNTSGSGFGVLIYQGTAAAFTTGNGYDLATGLGSINVGNLLTAWSAFHRTATTTTVGTVNPTSGTSGTTSFTIPVTVAPAPTASGETVSVTALASDKATVLGSFGPFTLTSGAASASTKLLPPSTAYVQAYYSGDSTLAASTSTPVALAVSGANQASKTTVGFVTFDANGNPVLPPTTGSVTTTYGSPYILQIAVTPTNGTACATSGGNTVLPPANPCAKGTVALTDNNSPLNDWPITGQATFTNQAKLIAEGLAEDQLVQLNAGSHSIVATFKSSDTNFQNSTSSALNVTVNPAATQIAVGSSATSITSGQSVTLTAQVSSSSNGESPCGITNGGTVTFTLDGASISGTVSYTAVAPTTTAGASCLASVSTTISGIYPPPNGRPRFWLTPLVPGVLALLSILLFAFGLKWMPKARRRAYVYAGFATLLLAGLALAGCGGGGGGGGGGGKSHTIGASYSGDTNYSKSGPVTTTVTVM
jgi:hypothetical protein